MTTTPAAVEILRGVLDPWKAAIDAHDPEGIAELFTEDAVFQGLHPYTVGRQGVADYYASQPLGLTAEYRTSKRGGPQATSSTAISASGSPTAGRRCRCSSASPHSAAGTTGRWRSTRCRTGPDSERNAALPFGLHTLLAVAGHHPMGQGRAGQGRAGQCEVVGTADCGSGPNVRRFVDLSSATGSGVMAPVKHVRQRVGRASLG